MLARPTVTLALVAALAAAAGCQGRPGPGAPGRADTRPKPTGTKRATPAPPPAGATRPVPQEGALRRITGTVSLLSDQGGGIISNNGGGFISDQGGGFLSDQGGGLVANNGAGFRLAQAKAPRRAALAFAAVQALDAEGRVLTTPAGQPLAATTGADGAFILSAVLPDEAVVLRVVLPTAGALKGGELRAVRTRDAADGALDLDTASSYAASFVLATYVQGRQATLDKLPAREARDLGTALAAAIAVEGATPSYQPADQVAATARLRAGDAAVQGALARIEAILLAGQADLGAGLPATSVALVTPAELVPEPGGGLLIAEQNLGRIRRLRADGTIATYADVDGGEHALNFAAILDMVRGPDGALYVAEEVQNRVRRLWPDGRIELVAGNGLKPQGPPAPGPAKDAAVRPSALAFRADGTLVMGGIHLGAPAHLVLVDAAGQARAEALPASTATTTSVAGIVIAPDGATWVLRTPEEATGGAELLRQPPGGAWATVASGLACDLRADLAPAPGGGVYLSLPGAHRIVHVALDGTTTPFAGTGLPESGGDGGPALQAGIVAPGGLAAGPDGALLVGEMGSGLVRRIGADGVITRVAGATGAVRVGDALGLAVSGPAGLAIDAAGAVFVSESTGHAVKKLVGGVLSRVGGSTAGHAGDGGPALAAALNTPAGLAFGPDGGLYVADAGNACIRRIAPDGVITAFAGHPGAAVVGPEDRAGAQVSFDALTGLAVGPDGTVFVASEKRGNVARIRPDGTSRVIIGRADKRGDLGDGPDGPAAAAKLDMPFGLAMRPGASPPELFVADLGNCRVRKIVDPAGAAPTVATVTGQGLPATLLGLLGGAHDPDAPVGAADALVLMPTSVCFDAAGDLYVAEMGTAFATSRGLTAPGVDLSALPVVPPRIRKFALSRPGAPVTVIAGPGGRVLTGRGDEGLRLVLGMAFDAQGRLVLADGGANQLKLIPAEALR